MDYIYTRHARSLDKEFSANWTCQTEPRPATTNCMDRVCENGNCVEGSRWGTCTCDPGWIGRTCDQCCDMPCENNGTCDIDGATQLRFCNCGSTTNFTGTRCEIPRPSPSESPVLYTTGGSNHWEIPLICSMLLLVLVIVAIFSALYTMYRRRHPWLVRALIRYYNHCIDDSNKKYDAFLSYRTSTDSDRRFVVFKLLPFLENNGYRVCIDGRDFIPGAAIANTIVEAIQESKRTILVLSPAYIRGQWPEFEAQRALHETLKKNHRIIPVIYQSIEDEKDQISSTLRHILESITYLEWDEEDTKEKEFWRRLLLALPKLEPKTAITTHENGDSPSLPSITSQTSRDGLLRHKVKSNTSSNLFSMEQMRQFFTKHSIKRNSTPKAHEAEISIDGETVSKQSSHRDYENSDSFENINETDPTNKTCSQQNVQEKIEISQSLQLPVQPVIELPVQSANNENTDIRISEIERALNSAYINGVNKQSVKPLENSKSTPNVQVKENSPTSVYDQTVNKGGKIGDSDGTAYVEKPLSFYSERPADSVTDSDLQIDLGDIRIEVTI